MDSFSINGTTSHTMGSKYSNTTTISVASNFEYRVPFVAVQEATNNFDESWVIGIGDFGKFRHRHLIFLIDYCDERNEMILINEYMEKGTLNDHLYGSGARVRRLRGTPADGGLRSLVSDGVDEDDSARTKFGQGKPLLLFCSSVFSLCMRGSEGWVFNRFEVCGLLGCGDVGRRKMIGRRRQSISERLRYDD
ncbi:hypothetical protein PIB30_078958, partial [Stylosanthes scabra]|nr:hypothetical protein [Stylosanthes scabra]